VRRRQLLAIGFTSDAIAHALRSGRLIRVHQGVYAVGAVPPAPADRAFGALLAVGDRSALAGDSAASAYRIRHGWRWPFTVITSRNCRIPDVNVLRSKRLTLADIRTVEGLRVVSPALTVLQIAADTPRPQLVRAIDDLRLAHGLTTGQLRGSVDDRR
jgi:hypothetical protein